MDYLFRNAKLTLEDVLKHAGKSQLQAAKDLKISESNFHKVIKRNKLSHYFKHSGILPNSNVSDQDIMDCSGTNIKIAAKKLGVAYNNLCIAIKKNDLKKHFPLKKDKKKCVTKEQIIAIAKEGYTRRDTAFLLGISPLYLKDLIKLWDLKDEFTLKKGKAAWVTRRGYCN